MQSAHLDTRVSRRRLLQIAGAGTAGIWFAGHSALPGAAQVTATPDDFAAVRTRWREQLIGDDSLDPDMPEVRTVITALDRQVENALATMERSVDRPYLWADKDFTGTDLARSIDLRQCYERLRQLALAYSIPAAARYADAEVLAAVIDGLDWMNEHKYYAGVTRYGNWYNWEIGTPQALLPTTLLLLDELGQERVDSYMAAIHFQRPTPSGQGSNLTWTSQIVAQRGALIDDGGAIELGVGAAPGAMEIVTSGNGFYTDGSFIQHRHHPYSGGYGRAMLVGMSRMLYLFAGTPWALQGQGLDNLVDWALEGYAPWLHKGAIIGAVRGRTIARANDPDHESGLRGVHALMWLAHSADDARAAQLRGIVRHTIEEDRYGNIFDTSELSTIAELRRVATDPAVAPMPPQIRNKQYPNMDRAVHRRPGFTFALAMSSSRIFSYESINSENLRGWHTGSGMHYLYNDDQAHYVDGYWATVDHARLPGTTVPVGLRADGSGADYLSGFKWAGGVAIGTKGISSMQFRTFAESDQAAAPTGRKSWFMFDDTIVAVGAFIRSSSGQVVESVVENRRLTGPARFVVNGVDQGAAGWDRTLPAGSWAHLAGPTPASGIGYVFGGGNPVRAVREQRTGAWSDINQNPTYLDETPLTREYVTLWFDNGVDPTDASYAYTLLPGATAAQVAAYAADPDVEVLVNTRQVQAARWGQTLGMTIWERGAPAVNGYRCSGPASVLVVHEGGGIRLAVSDPTHAADSVTLTLPSPTTVITADDRIVVKESASRTVLEIDLAGSAGAAVEAELSVGRR